MLITYSLISMCDMRRHRVESDEKYFFKNVEYYSCVPTYCSLITLNKLNIIKERKEEI